MEGRGKEASKKRSSQRSGLVVDFAFGEFEKDVSRSNLVFLVVAIFGPKGEVAVPLLALALIGDQEARPGFSFAFEETYGTATKTVQAGGTPS